MRTASWTFGVILHHYSANAAQRSSLALCKLEGREAPGSQMHAGSTTARTVRARQNATRGSIVRAVAVQLHPQDRR